jgi:CubicO group peptidase (beta-lactamase class C family)
VLDEKLISKIGIPADAWDWLIGREVQQDKDFYPLWPSAWDYLDPPYEINGHPVRSGPGWVVMSAKNLARFGHLVATGGNWKGEQLLDPAWVRSHSGGNGSGLHGENRRYTAMGRVTTEGIDMRFSIARESLVPQDVFVGPVNLKRMV